MSDEGFSPGGDQAGDEAGSVGQESGRSDALNAPADARGGKVLPVDELLARIAGEMRTEQGQQVVRLEVLEAIESRYATPSPPLPGPLRGALAAQGISRLYTHQVESLDRARNGENIVVVTATSSGKTLCYNLPVLESILHDRSARAIYVYPINALVNDQLKSLFRLNLELGSEAVSVARYTGSLNSGQRRMIRERSPNILLTNPEMLHLSFLLWHQNWEELWSHLRYIVVDEVHTYRGVFGANMAQLLRRTLRMARHYGADPQCVFCSATIANPKELAETLTGLPFSVVDHDGAGRGRRYFALWNPPLLDRQASNIRRSYAEESVDLMLHCMRANYNTIVFTRARQLTERMLRLSRTVTDQAAEGHLAERISSYRAGYLAEEREDIEDKLKGGDIQGIITTNALEMGIDIGGLDAAIISGYPGTIMSTWQQAGRAGRRGREALIFLVASQNPLDQYYMHHPQEFFAQPHELAVIDQDNQYIQLKHLLCAARELPLLSAEIDQMPPKVQASVRELYQAGLLAPCDLDGAEGLAYPKSRRDIHFRVSLRAASHETFQIVDENRNEIGTIEPPNVYREAHPGAIYQHGGDDYRVTFLDRQRKIVHVREEAAPHYTRPVSTSSLHIEEVYDSRIFQLGDLPFVAALGDVLVEETIRGYQELQLGTEELVKRVNLDYPLAMRLHTTAMWVALPAALSEGDPAPASDDDGEQAPQESAADDGDTVVSDIGAGLHAVQHLLTGVMPLLVMCDRRDVDGSYHARHPDLDAPAVFLYDSYEGGIGLAEVAYQRLESLLRLAHDTVARCGCATGCPSCIQSGACRLRNEQLDKRVAQEILASMLHPGVVADVELLARYQAALPSVRKAAPEARRQPEQGRALQDLMEYTRQKTIYDHLTGAGEQVQPLPEQRFAKGDWVEQSPYGRGIVLESRLEGQREMVRIRFARRGMIKEVDASKGALRKVE